MKLNSSFCLVLVGTLLLVVLFAASSVEGAVVRSTRGTRSSISAARDRQRQARRQLSGKGGGKGGGGPDMGPDYDLDDEDEDDEEESSTSSDGDDEDDTEDTEVPPSPPEDNGDGDDDEDREDGGGGGVVIPPPPTVLPCTDLDNNTAAALYQAIQETPYGGTLSLCGGETILFEQELTLVDTSLTIQSVNGPTIFDGQGVRRLFTLGEERLFPRVTWTVERPPAMIPDLTFKNIIFRNGFGATEYRDGKIVDGGGGAFQITGYIADTLRFERCSFVNNTARESHPGGALDIWSASALSRLYLQECYFVNNTAHQGGAVYGKDIEIVINSTSFTDNRICGLQLGTAIFQASSSLTDAYVDCVGSSSNVVFQNNRDDFCLDPNEAAKPIVGCARNCGATFVDDTCTNAVV